MPAAERLPRPLAFRLAMGDDISLDELMHHGLVTKVVDDEDLDAAAQGWINHLLELPAQHVLATKQLMNRVEPFQMTAQMRAAEYHVRSQLDVLDDTFEAANAFAERRPPVVKGH